MEKSLASSSKGILSSANNSFQKLLDSTDLTLKDALKNPYLLVSLKTFLVLYAAFAAPNLPRNLALMMDSTIVRIIFATLIVFSVYKDPVTAILLAIIFIVTLQTADKYKLYDSSLSVLDPNGISWLPSAKEGAVVGKVLTDNVDNVLKEKILVKELLTTKKLETQVDEEAKKADDEFIRRLKHTLVTSIPVRSEPAKSEPAKREQKLALTNRLTNVTRMTGQSLIDGASSVVSGGYNSAANVLEKTHGGLFRTTNGLINSSEILSNSALTSSTHLGRSVTNGVGNVGSGVVSGVRHTTNGVLDGVQYASNGLVLGAKDVKTGLVGGVNTLGDCLLDSASQITTGLLSGVKQVSNGLLTGAEIAGSGTMTGVRSVGDGLRSGLGDTVDGVHRAAMGINTGLADSTYILGNEVGGSTQMLGSGLRSGVVSLAQPFQLAEHFNNVPKATNNAKLDSCAYSSYVTNDQLVWANSNEVPGTNQSSVVKTFDNQHNAQGFELNWANPYAGTTFANY
jgi:hypothetical protein